MQRYVGEQCRVSVGAKHTLAADSVRRAPGLGLLELPPNKQQSVDLSAAASRQSQLRAQMATMRARDQHPATQQHGMTAAPTLEVYAVPYQK